MRCETKFIHHFVQLFLSSFLITNWNCSWKLRKTLVLQKLLQINNVLQSHNQQNHHRIHQLLVRPRRPILEIRRKINNLHRPRRPSQLPVKHIRLKRPNSHGDLMIAKSIKQTSFSRIVGTYNGKTWNKRILFEINEYVHK